MKLKLNRAFIPVTALAVSWSFVACDKPADKTAEQPAKPAAEQVAKAADATKAAVDKVASAVTAAVVPAADASKLGETYAFVSRLPRDVEMFSSAYRMHDVWLSIANSKWGAAAVDLMKKEPQGQQMLEQWQSDPGMQKGKEFAEAFLGNEYFTVGAAGFAQKMEPWMELLQSMGEMYYQAALTGGMMGGSPADTEKAMMRMVKDNAAVLMPKAVKLELPPLLMGFKAGKVRAEFDDFIKKGLESAQLPPGVESNKFKVGDKYEFQSLSVIVRKLIPASQEEALVAQLKEMVGDEAAAKQHVATLMAKHFEISWGWVDDYLIVSLGSDHAHVKFSTGVADSALSIPDVAARAAIFAGKKPIGLGFVDKAFFDKLAKPMQLAAPFAKMTESLQGMIAPDAVAGMTADVKKLEVRLQDLFKTVNSSQVTVSYLDGGMRADSIGGPRSANATAAQPLTFSSLSTPATVMSMVSHSDSANSAKTTELVEESAAMVWGWYEKYGRKMLPADGQQNAATMEAMAVPMVKDFWKSCRLLGTALGDNSAMLVDLNGKMPPIPGAPKVAVEGGKIPRIAFAMELKNRAALSEAWKGFEKLVKQGIALVPRGADAPPIPEPQMKKEGDVEIHFIELPMPTGDLLPHIAISKDKWMISTSPSYSVELAKLPITGSAKQDMEMRMEFGAVADFAGHWLKLVASNPPEFFQGDVNSAEQFQKVKPMLESAIGLVRSIKSASIQMGEEAGKTHMTMSILVEDLK